MSGRLLFEWPDDVKERVLLHSFQCLRQYHRLAASTTRASSPREKPTSTRRYASSHLLIRWRMACPTYLLPKLKYSVPPVIAFNQPGARPVRRTELSDYVQGKQNRAGRHWRARLRPAQKRLALATDMIEKVQHSFSTQEQVDAAYDEL